MPKEIRSKEEFTKIVGRAEECRVKLVKPPKSKSDAKEKLKVKARTKRYLYTIVFENVDEGVEFVKTIKEKCAALNLLDPELEGMI